MDFADQIKQFSKRVAGLKDTIQTEEATKTSLVMPFFAMLGYDVFNPMEFTPEFTADVGIKKGEKVDYAIMRDGVPVILVEAKWIGESLAQHDSQLFRYFGTTTAKFGILTNGLVYKFYTDLEASNKMDETPFLEVNMLDLKEAQIAELKRFQKSVFSVDEVFGVASELKYSNEFKQFFASELQNPSDEMVKLFIARIYKGMKTQNIIEKFRPVVKKALGQFINEMMNDRIKTALNAEEKVEEVAAEPIEEEAVSKIVTTQEEMEVYFLVKTLLKKTVPVMDITIKDTESYLAILYKNNVRKWICRVVLTPSQRSLILPTESKELMRFPIESVYDIEDYKEQLSEVVKRYL